MRQVNGSLDQEVSTADLSHRSFIGCIFVGADLAEADLTETIFRGCNLHNASILESNLTRANLNGSTLCGADLRRARKWTRHERAAAQSRAFASTKEHILPLAIYDVAVPGLNRTVGYVHISEGTDKIAQLILNKIRDYVTH